MGRMYPHRSARIARMPASPGGASAAGKLADARHRPAQRRAWIVAAADAVARELEALPRAFEQGETQGA